MNKSIGPWIRSVLVPSLMLAAIAAMLGGCRPPVEGYQSSDKAIAAFAFASPPASGVIDEKTKNITVTVPYGTNVTALVATFTTTGASVMVGSTVQVSGVTANNFSSPVVYTVTAEDSSTANYTVTVTAALSSDKAITSFAFASPHAAGVIDENTKAIVVTVPCDADLTALVATFMTTGSSVKVGSTIQISGVTANNFSNSLIYTVTAADASTADYTVTVTLALSSAKAISGFSFSSPSATGTIDENTKTIAVTVPYGTVVTALVATFTTTGANVMVGSILQVSGVTANNFSSPVIYSVTADDSTTANYTVTVTAAPEPYGRALWARTVSTGSGESRFCSTSVDSNGNVCAAGYVGGTGTYTFGNGVTAAGSGSCNAVLVKYDSSGAALWARTISAGTAESRFQSTSVDSGGNVYAAGCIGGTGTYSFGSGVTAAGTYAGWNLVLVKYDAGGTAQWARTVSTGAAGSGFNSVAVDSGGNIYAAGYISDVEVFTFGTGVTAAGVGNYTLVLVKYDPSGNAVWARTVSTGTVAPSWFYATAVDSGGNVYAAGQIYGSGSYAFGNGVTAAGPSDGWTLVLAKYDSSGAAQWARTVISGISESGFNSVAVDSGGSAYAAGYISGSGTYTFESGVTAARPSSGYFDNNVVLVKYDALGTALWARTVSTGSSASVFRSTSVDSSGNVYAAGYIWLTGTYTFGSGVTAAGTCSSSCNMVLVKYDATGTALWARTVRSGTSSSWFGGAAVEPGGNVYAAGYISGSGTYTFGTGVTAAGSSSSDNVLLVKYLK